MILYQIDTNPLLRYLTKDDLAKVSEVEKIARKAMKGLVHIYLCESVVLETAVVLKNYFKHPKRKIVEFLQILLALDWLEIENFAIVSSAVRLYSAYSLDLVDCLVLARSKILDHKIFTFDRKLRKISSTTV